MAIEWGDNLPPPPAASSNVVAIGAWSGHYVSLLNDSLPVDGSPFIIQNPFHLSTRVGNPALFVIGATGVVPLKYQWQFNGTNIPGANRPAMLLTNVSFASGGSYQCLVSNTFGAVTSSPAILALSRSTPMIDTTASTLRFTNGSFGLRVIGLSGHGNVIIHAS